MSRIFRPLKNRRRAAVLSLGLAFAAALAAAAAGGRFGRRRFGLSYRISKLVFISWLAFKKRLRLRALARRLRIQ